MNLFSCMVKAGINEYWKPMFRTSVSLAKIDSDSVAVCELPLRKSYPSLKYLIYEVNFANDVWNEPTLDQSFRHRCSTRKHCVLANTYSNHLEIAF